MQVILFYCLNTFSNQFIYDVVHVTAVHFDSASENSQAFLAYVVSRKEISLPIMLQSNTRVVIKIEKYVRVNSS